MVQILDASESSLMVFKILMFLTRMLLKGLSFIYAVPQYQMGRDSLLKRLPN